MKVIVVKKIRSFFLFGKSTDQNKEVFWIWNFAMIVASGIALGVMSMIFAFGNYPSSMFRGYFENSLIAVLNILPVVLLVLLMYALTGRSWIAFLTVAVPVFVMSCGNYFKLIFRDDPFMFSDVTNIGMAMKFTGEDSYEIVLTKYMWLSVAAIVLGTLFLAFFVRGHIRFRFRACGLAAIVIAFIPLWSVYMSDSIYNVKTKNAYIEHTWSSTETYVAHGFIYPFIHSIPSAFPDKPVGYSPNAAKQILSAYTAKDIPEEKKVNVIGIQLEAFNDFERLGIEGISSEVYAAYHLLEEESYSGSLVTNIFAGGTIDTERCFLTGNTTLDDFRAPTGSYVWYLKDQGYYAEGAHPCYNWFYNRLNINSYMGFDNYYFSEDRYNSMTGGVIALDDVFLPDLYELYQSRDKSVPYFNFSVSYQGHGPYLSEQLDKWGDGWWDGEYNDNTTYYILNNYLGSVHDTAVRLYDLVSKLREDDAPVVLVVFGDHNPWLGNSSSAYKDLGVNFDMNSETGFYNYYSTRYLIWANDKAKELLGNDFIGEGPTVSPAFLMNVLFEQCGFGEGNEYMQFMSDVMEQMSVVTSNGFYVEQGALTDELSDKGKELADKLAIVQFYRKKHVEW